MKAVVVSRPGRMAVEEAPSPVVGPGQVKVDVQAAGVNYADVLVRMGLYASAKEYVGWPITPGFEVAGRVVALGEGAAGPAVGTEVVAVTRFGGYATELVVPAHQVFVRPVELSVRAAAAFPAVHLTAWYALCELAHPRPGAKVLVHSAAGGVGGALVQIARILGCEPVAVVGASHKVEVARALGAAAVIDKSREALWPAVARHAPGGYDVVLDANGVETLRGSADHLRPGGKLVVYGAHTMLVRGRDRPSWPKLAIDWLRTPRFNPLDLITKNRSVLAFNLSYLFDRSDLLAEGMAALTGWLHEGRLKPPATQAFPLARVAEAHRALESGQTTGKLVLAMP